MQQISNIKKRSKTKKIKTLKEKIWLQHQKHSPQRKELINWASSKFKTFAI